jgi:hypothetical protein
MEMFPKSCRVCAGNIRAAGAGIMLLDMWDMGKIFPWSSQASPGGMKLVALLAIVLELKNVDVNYSPATTQGQAWVVLKLCAPEVAVPRQQTFPSFFQVGTGISGSGFLELQDFAVSFPNFQWTEMGIVRAWQQS